MPLNILIPIVVLGVTGLVLFIRWMRPTAAFSMDGEANAIEVWNHFNPEAVATSVSLNTSKTHALVTTANGPGLIWAMGADPVTRVFDDAIDCKTSANGLEILTRDFTAPKISIPLSDDAQKAVWLQLLKAKT